jgi:hypothetical protein
MQEYEISFDGKSFRLEGLPFAAIVVQLDGPEAKWLADHALHQYDLKFAQGCLDRLASATDDPTLVLEAVWRSAVASFVKCFDSTGVRTPIDAAVLYAGDPAASAAYNHIRDLRRKHIVHDENPWTQCYPVAILNSKGTSKKVADIRCVAFHGDTRENVPNLANLIYMALKWLNEEFDRRHASLLAKLEQEDYDVLARLPQPTYTAPTAGEVRRKR